MNIRLIQALNFRCFRHLSYELGTYQILVGPNGSGKSSFLDIFAFLGRLTADGVPEAVSEQAACYTDLTFRRNSDPIEIAVETEIPEAFRAAHRNPAFDTIRYEVAIGPDEITGEVRVLNEQIILIEQGDVLMGATPDDDAGEPDTVFIENDFRLHKNIISDRSQGELHLYPEKPIDAEERLTSDDYIYPQHTNPRKTILSSLTSFRTEFPIAAWLADRLSCGIFHIDLSNTKLREPTSRRYGFLMTEDGSTLPCVVSDLRQVAPGRFKEWLTFVQTAFPDIKDIVVSKTPDDGRRHLSLIYADGLELPSWLVSHGTLRVLALSIIPFLPDNQPIYLVEEPDDTLHPLNIELVLNSLRAVSNGQILLATHSPVVIRITDLEDIIVFSRNEIHGASLTPAQDHPTLMDWAGAAGLETLFTRGDLA